MNQLPPDDQAQKKQERAEQESHRQRQQLLPWQWYRSRTLKAKVALGSALALVLLLLAVTLLTTRWPFSVPHKEAGVHVTVTAIYYVSPTGNDANDGSIAHPFASIQKAANVAQAGATIHVLSGIYTQPVYTTAKGTAQARITFISDVKWGAKIITKGVRISWVNDGDFVDIQGFDLTGDGDVGINNNGSYVHIIGNHVHNYAVASCSIHGASGIEDSPYLGNHDNDVIGNVIDHIGPPLATYCNFDQGIYHSTFGGTIANNIVYEIAAYGIHNWNLASNVTIANNLVFDCGAGGILVAADLTVADNFLVVNNISIYNHHLGIYEYGLTGVHNRYLNNLLYANPVNLLLQHGNKAQGTLTVDPRFVNFKIDGSGDYHLAAGSPSIGTGTSTGEPTTDMDGFSRTIVTTVDRGPYAYRSGGARTGRHIIKRLH
jgi:hypothetical protein